MYTIIRGTLSLYGLCWANGTPRYWPCLVLLGKPRILRALEELFWRKCNVIGEGMKILKKVKGNQIRSLWYNCGIGSCSYNTPLSAKLKYSPLGAIIIWSRTLTSKSWAASLIFFVMSLSRWLASNFPLGWLCASKIPTERVFNTTAKRIRRSTKVPVMPPCDIW